MGKRREGDLSSLDQWDSLHIRGGDDCTLEVEEEGMVLKAVEGARRELLSARSYFDSVSDPDMVDHAIYTLQAAEKKYDYLVKYARRKGYRQNMPFRTSD